MASGERLEKARRLPDTLLKNFGHASNVGVELARVYAVTPSEHCSGIQPCVARLPRLPHPTHRNPARAFPRLVPSGSNAVEGQRVRTPAERRCSELRIDRRGSSSESEFSLSELAGDIDQEVDVVGVGSPVDDRGSQRGLSCVGGCADEHASVGA